jgi:hypothetical protein
MKMITRSSWAMSRSRGFTRSENASKYPYSRGSTHSIKYSGANRAYRHSVKNSTDSGTLNSGPLRCVCSIHRRFTLGSK